MESFCWLKSNSKWRISKIPYFNESIYINFITNMLIFYLEQIIEAEYNGKISMIKRISINSIFYHILIKWYNNDS